MDNIMIIWLLWHSGQDHFRCLPDIQMPRRDRTADGAKRDSPIESLARCGSRSSRWFGLRATDADGPSARASDQRDGG